MDHPDLLVSPHMLKVRLCSHLTHAFTPFDISNLICMLIWTYGDVQLAYSVLIYVPYYQLVYLVIARHNGSLQLISSELRAEI